MHGFVSSRSAQSPASSPLLRPTRSPATTASNAGQNTTQALLFKSHRLIFIFVHFSLSNIVLRCAGRAPSLAVPADLPAFSLDEPSGAAPTVVSTSTASDNGISQ